MVYQNNYSGRRVRSRSMSLFTPFIFLISFGIIGVLIFNLFGGVSEKGNVKAAYSYVSEGMATVKSWGTEDYFDLNSGTLIVQGDTIQTEPGSKIILEFFEGTIVRLNGDTVVELLSVNEKASPKLITLNLISGSLWVNKNNGSTARLTTVTVKSENLNVISDGASVFSYELTPFSTLRVISGLAVKADVLSMDKASVVESASVGVGQQAVFTQAVLERFWEYQSPNVLEALADDFKLTAWYLWNSSEDLSPIKINLEVKSDNEVLDDPELVSVSPVSLYEDENQSEESLSGVETNETPTSIDSVSETLVSEVVVDTPISGTTDGSVSTIETQKPETLLVPLRKPEFTSVSGVTVQDENGFYVVKDNPAVIKGTVSGAEKVVVSGYTLSKFKSGDLTWTYFANADYNLMKKGENTYEVYGVDSLGNKSEVLTIKVLYSPPGASQVTETPVSPEIEEVKEEEQTTEGNVNEYSGI